MTIYRSRRTHTVNATRRNIQGEYMQDEVRIYCDSCGFYAVAALNLDGVYEFNAIINGHPHKMTAIISLGDQEISHANALADILNAPAPQD